MSGWEADEFRRGDEERILTLFRDSYGHVKSLAHWQWEFLGAPAGPGIMSVARAGARIVGHYAVVPVDMVCNGVPMRAAQSVDSMTASDFRLQGVFATLARSTFAAAAAAGIELVYGFPNRHSHHGLVKTLGFLPVAEVREYQHRFGWKRFVTLRRAGAIAKEVVDAWAEMRRGPGISLRNVEPGAGFTAEHDDLWSRVVGKIGVGVAKTSAYLNWRYGRRPASDYRILQYRESRVIRGFVVWTHAGRCATLVDMVVESPPVARQLTRAVVQEARRAGCGLLRGWELIAAVDPESAFLEFPTAARPTWLTVLPLAGVARSDLVGTGRWAVHKGDSDGI